MHYLLDKHLLKAHRAKWWTKHPSNLMNCWNLPCWIAAKEAEAKIFARLTDLNNHQTRIILRVLKVLSGEYGMQLCTTTTSSCTAA